MPLQELIQRIIHILTVGTGSRVTRVLMLGMIIFSVCLWYDVCDFQNLSTPEAMDSAQLARNIATGRGYTTDFVRPFSIFLVNRWNTARGVSADVDRLQNGHPDLANPPVYPVFLAGWMKVLPFKYAVKTKGNFWGSGGSFARYEPDFLIAVINQLLFLVVVWQVFLITRKLFDVEAAWVSAALVFAGELFWEFSVSGLSTMLVMVIFLGLTRALIAYEETARGMPLEPEPVLLPDLMPVILPPLAPETVVARKKLLKLAVIAGLLAGLGALTRYAFGWVMLPVAAFLVMFGGRKRWPQALTAAGAFLLLLAPWVLRNILVSGTPFGTAGFALIDGGGFFPEFRLERALRPDLSVMMNVMQYVHKLLSNLGDILQNDWPKLGRSWATILFFAGLMMNFRGLPIRRLRYFTLMCLATFTVVQALGQTQLTVLSPEVNSENLLVLVLPLIMIYGVVFFFTILDQYEMPLLVPVQTIRYTAMAGFLIVMSLPMLGTLCSASVNPAVSSYNPPIIQKASGWMKPDELMMSDAPWAVAWYGDRQCLWLTLNTQDDFYAINDYVKPVQGLYLSQQMLDIKIISDCLSTPPNSWGNFVLSKVTGAPSGFPLKVSPGTQIINSGLFLTDRPRWLGAQQ